MKASELLKVTTSYNGAVTINGIGKNDFHVLGCSNGSSASGITNDKMSQNSVDRVSFMVEKGSEVLIALHVYDRQSKHGTSHHLFLKGSWVTANPDPVMLTEIAWVPEIPNRLGQVYWHSGDSCSRYALSTLIDGLIYTTAYISDKDREKLSNFRTVPNGGDLICRYLLGKAEAEEIRNAAIDYVVEEAASAILPRLLAQNEKLLSELNTAKADLEGTKESLTQTKRELSTTKGNLTVAEATRDKARSDRDTAYLLLGISKKVIGEQRELNKYRYIGRNAVEKVLNSFDNIVITTDQKRVLNEAIASQNPLAPKSW